MAKLTNLPRGPVALAPDVEAQLGRLAAQLGRPAAVTVDPALVEEVEAELRTAIPFEILAVLAVENRYPIWLAAWTRDIDDYYVTSGGGMRFPHVAFAQLVGTAGDWTAEPVFAAFKRTDDRSEARLVRWDLRKPGPNGEPYSLAQYLAERHEPLRPGPAAPLKLAIEPPPVVERWATHAKFGRGRVLVRAEGKTKIEFADGVRTLADNFLKFE
ncbi:hypothetical protein [Nannocystis punicea]|uniref:Uncharacterized protein n=1 Tax=Nannocystis punicea TaxID=2995304 RepID=A0ABY7H8Q5_9BACT|nr:hypothetical protein [Nannocystis poenicansa]WAS95655.1 hypothetical protein O0S08_05790 [Nannocystis poenicansa]